MASETLTDRQRAYDVVARRLQLGYSADAVAVLAEQFAQVRAEERAAIVAWMRSKDWNTMQDWNVDPFEGDHRDVVEAVAACLELGEHEEGS